MAKVLIAYGTSEGRTAQIAERIAAVLRAQGHDATALDTRSLPRAFSPDDFEAVIVAGSVHYGRHQRLLHQFVRRHRQFLQTVPSAFVSVSLSASEAEGRGEAERLASRFSAASGWRPDETAVFGGALAYTRYSPFKRLLMRSIMNVKGGPTNTKRDWDFTDWRAVEGFAKRFAARLQAGGPKTPPPPMQGRAGER